MLNKTSVKDLIVKAGKLAKTTIAETGISIINNLKESHYNWVSTEYGKCPKKNIWISFKLISDSNILSGYYDGHFFINTYDKLGYEIDQVEKWHILPQSESSKQELENEMKKSLDTYHCGVCGKLPTITNGYSKYTVFCQDCNNLSLRPSGRSILFFAESEIEAIQLWNKYNEKSESAIQDERISE